MVLNSPAMQEEWETRVLSLGLEDSLEKEVATHSSIPTGKIPHTLKPRRLWGNKRV